MNRLHTNPVYKSRDGSFHTSELAAIKHDLMEILRAEFSHEDAINCIQIIQSNTYLVREFLDALQPKG